MQIHDFMGNTHEAVRKLRELLDKKYILGLQGYAQFMIYSTLFYFEFNILSTEAGGAEDQGIHIDLGDGRSVRY